MIWHLPVSLSQGKAPAFGTHAILLMIHAFDGCSSQKRQVCTVLSRSIRQGSCLGMNIPFIHKSFIKDACLADMYSPE